MDRAAQLPCSFPVDDPYLINILFFTEPYVLRDEVPYLPRSKGVEVKHTINGDLNGLHVVSHDAIIHLSKARYNLLPLYRMR